MARVIISRRGGKYKIEYNGNMLHKDKDYPFVKGWLDNQIGEFSYMYIEVNKKR